MEQTVKWYCWGPYYWLFLGQASQAVTSPSALLPRRGDALPPWDLRDCISRSRSRWYNVIIMAVWESRTVPLTQTDATFLLTHHDMFLGATSIISLSCKPIRNICTQVLTYDGILSQQYCLTFKGWPARGVKLPYSFNDILLTVLNWIRWKIIEVLIIISTCHCKVCNSLPNTIFFRSLLERLGKF